ncbi:MAG TPA: hypothetical protein ENI98_06410 [Gammaproteobacteria bacterium]|nr:hypothetical protein [Gammaproteobacteria bacterium]
MKQKLLLLILAAVSTSIIADSTRETWECTEQNNNHNVLVTAIADRATGDGFIKLAGVTYKADFSFAGLDRQWQFGQDKTNNTFHYVFKILPNGQARYFDLRTHDKGIPPEPTMTLFCDKKTSGWSVNLPGNPSKQNNTQKDTQDLPALLILNIDE